MSFWEAINPVSDNRDDDAAKKATNDANSALQNSAATFGAQNAQTDALAAQDAAQNYYGNAQDVYGQQQQAAQMLQNQANGTAPSAAQIQMGLGLGQANQQAQAAALSQQGGVLSGNTQRNMLNAQAANSQNVLGQTGILRAQEQASGQQAYAQLLGQMQQQQQNQGQLIRNQGQDYLNQRAGLNQATYNATQGTAQNILGNTQGNINAQAQAAQGAKTALMNTAAQVGAAVATGGTSLAAQGVGKAAAGANASAPQPYVPGNYGSGGYQQPSSMLGR